MKEHNYENCHNLTCRRKCEDYGYNKAIDDFYIKALNFEDYIDQIEEKEGVLLYSGRDITNMIVKIKRELKLN